MRTIPPGLVPYLSAKPRQLAHLFYLQLVTGEEYFFTDHDQPLTVGADKFKASNAIQCQAIEASSGDVAVNTEILINYVDGLTRDFAAGGYYDNATFICSICAWPNPNAGLLNLVTGTVQQKAVNDKRFGTFTIKGIQSVIDGYIVEPITAECRANLGDARCKVDLVPHTFNFTVTAISVDRRIFDATIVGTLPTGDFDFGRLRFTGDTFDIEIGKHTNLGGNSHRIQLAIPRVTEIVVANTGDITRGCNKTLTRCMFFDNVVNRRAEDFVPGPDVAIKVQR